MRVDTDPLGGSPAGAVSRNKKIYKERRKKVADKHPYVPGPGGLVQVIKHFRSSFPVAVTADTLRKLGFAPKNESYVLNILRFLGLVDQDDGKRTKEAERVFNLHDDEAFQKEFSLLVRNAYSELFNLHGDNTWTLDQNSLMTFFRSSDQSTAIVGQRQAATFRLLAAFSGHGDVPEAKAVGGKPRKDVKKPRPNAKVTEPPASQVCSASVGNGLSDRLS
jgi:hypothetical protein